MIAIHKQFVFCVLVFCMALRAGTPLFAQDNKDSDLTSPASQEFQKKLASDPPLFLKFAVQAAKWNDPAEPVKIVGPIYFVGTQGLAAYLIQSSTGLILMNTGMPESAPMIVDSVKKLGFDPHEIKLLLACHAHIDHVGAMAYIKKLTGAEMAITEGDLELLESGGRSDFHYAAFPEFLFEPVKADRVLRDGEEIVHGDVKITVFQMPGHTKGAATFALSVVDGDKTYDVLFPEGMSVNPGYRLVSQPDYPGIADDFRRTNDRLAKFKPDIWLGAHTETMKFREKSAKAATEGVKAWVDPIGYENFIAEQRKKLDEVIRTESVPAN